MYKRAIILLSFLAYSLTLVHSIVPHHHHEGAKVDNPFTRVESFSTVMILSIIRWPYNIHLLSIGVLGITATLAGYRLAKKKTLNWTRFHTICMGASYILLMTGFYVDNGKNLPFWKLFPQWFFWVFPAVAGIPIIVFVLRNHPLNKLRP